MSVDLSNVKLDDFIQKLNKDNNLKLSAADVRNATLNLKAQWFDSAADLENLDAEAVGFLELPKGLDSAILKYFGKEPVDLTADPLVYIPDEVKAAVDDEQKAKDDKVFEQMMANMGHNRKDSTANLEEVLKKVIDESGDNAFVMSGIQNLLKKGIQESGKSTMKKSVLRDYLKKVNSRRNSSGSISEMKAPAPAKPVDPNAAPCLLCSGNQDESVTLDCNHAFDKCCLHDYIMERVGQKRAVGINCPNPAGCDIELNVKYIQSVLDVDEFNSYLEATLMGFIEQDSLSFTCPNDACKAVISIQSNPPQEVPAVITEKDADGNPLTPEAWRHFMEFRVRCRDCNTVFCADCKRVPYHKGHTCAGFVEFQKARHCRFCGTQLTQMNTAKDAPGPGLRDCCTEEECLDKRDVCCSRIKGCGCPCNGVRDEKEEDCLPCLKHDLEGLGDEFCSICYVEALQDAPCIQLGNGCEHVFHYQCVLNRIKAGWPGARISFEFLSCPLCHKDSSGHPALVEAIKPVLEMKKRVEAMALDRLKYEGRSKDPQIVNKGGRFHNNPLGFAMNQYLFYKCHQCKKAYFAGGYQCQEANAPFNPEELMCPSCQPGSFDDCPKHGKDWLAFKCRYCCNFANWYCWGRTHFCGNCHKSGVWQKLAEFRTGKNKKRFWQYPQCAGLLKAMQPVINDKSLNDEQKEKKLETVTADPAQCPLHVPHPPNGMEFGLGCSMCEDKKDEAKNEEAARKAKEEAEKMAQAFENVKKAMAANQRTGVELKYTGDFDGKGLFAYLGTCAGSIKWANPADSGFVEVRSSGMMGDSAPLSAVCGQEVVRCVTKPIRASWICVDLKNMSFTPTAYTLRHYSSWDTECLRNWVLEGSNDGLSWDPLKMHRNDQSLNLKGQSRTWPINCGGRRYRMFRLVQTGVNSNNHFYLACSGMEFYGYLHGSVPKVKLLDDEEKVPAQSFKYTYDFDTNGILYTLGTNFGEQPWQNPALIGAVNVSATDLAEKPPSMPIYALVGRATVRCVTMARPNMWMAVDLKDKKARLTHYTLRHYASWDTEALRNWNFEASNDGVKWTVLRRHTNDNALNAKGATYTWKILDPQGFFSMFRIHQTGKNSNNHYYLACSGIELYGDLKISPPLRVPKAGVPLPYIYDFDTNGLFYWLGTRGKRQPWRNPHLMGLVVCSAAAMATNPPSHPPYAIVGRHLVRCVTAAQPNMWMMVDLKDKAIQVTHYTLRHYNSWDTECLRNWVLQASNDGYKWVILREHRQDVALNKKGATFTWAVNSGNMRFRMLRILQTGLNSNNHHYLACSGLEVYGHLYNSSQADLQVRAAPAGAGILSAQPISRPIVSAKPGPPPPQGLSFRDGTMFNYQYDMDQNGILYWLGTAGKTRPYQNPGALGVVKVTSSPLASQSLPAWAACGREVVRCVTEPKKGTWFCFDFGNIHVIPTAYTLRHYSSWDIEALRNWKLEGSCDGKKWKTLIQHKKDKHLDKKGATHTWPIPKINKSYTMFKITQTGKNSNKHWYLSLSGFELYGSIWSFRKKL